MTAAAGSGAAAASTLKATPVETDAEAPAGSEVVPAAPEAVPAAAAPEAPIDEAPVAAT